MLDVRQLICGSLRRACIRSKKVDVRRDRALNPFETESNFLLAPLMNQHPRRLVVTCLVPWRRCAQQSDGLAGGAVQDQSPQVVSIDSSYKGFTDQFPSTFKIRTAIPDVRVVDVGQGSSLLVTDDFERDDNAVHVCRALRSVTRLIEANLSDGALLQELQWTEITERGMGCRVVVRYGHINEFFEEMKLDRMVLWRKVAYADLVFA